MPAMLCYLYIYIFINIYINISIHISGRLVFVVKLIAETKEENVLLAGLTALLGDLGVAVAAYRTDESYALTLWSVYDFIHTCADDWPFGYEETVLFFEKIEPQLQAYTASAGIRFLYNTFRNHTHTIFSLSLE